MKELKNDVLAYYKWACEKFPDKEEQGINYLFFTLEDNIKQLNKMINEKEKDVHTKRFFYNNPKN